MMFYDDITFCRFYQNCKKGKTCIRSLTEDVLLSAEKFGIPICEYTSEPGCYELFDKK